MPRRKKTTPTEEPARHRCGLYLRVSTDRQAAQKEGSLEEQEQRLHAHVASRPPGEGWLITDVYREEGRSGKDTDRPEIQRLLTDVRSGKINTVVVVKLDRLTRSLLDFYKLHATFDRYGVDFIAIDESFDTSTPTGRAMLKITLVFAELERERTADRTRRSMAARAERGLWNGGIVPLGYDTDPDNPGVLVVNEKEAAIVRLAFETYLETASTLGTARKLNELGLRTKAYVSTRGRAQGGRKFAKLAIYNMLKNPLYRGLVTSGEQTFPGRHEAIIDEDTWRRVQAVRAENASRASSVKRPTRHQHILLGLLRCSQCGTAMTTSWGTSKTKRVYAYYQCVAVNKRGKDACKIGRVPAGSMEKRVVEIIRGFVKRPEVIEATVAGANEAVAESFKPLTEKRDALRAELAKVEAEGRTLAAKLATAEFEINSFVQDTLTDLSERRSSLRQSLRQAEDELAAVTAHQLDASVVHQALTEFDRVWDALDPHEQRDLLRLIVRRIEVNDRTLAIELFQGENLVLSLSDGEPHGSTEKGSVSVRTGSAEGTPS